MPEQAYKHCGRCDETKPTSEFYRRGEIFKSECKACSRLRTKEWRQANPTRAKAQLERWIAENPERHLELARKRDQRYRDRHPEREAERHRRRKAETPERELEYSARHRRKHPEKARARDAVHRAVADGTLAKPSLCEGCGGAFESRDIHGHHSDYLKPLDVEWLCRSCHNERHAAQ